jgi:hypothetical protein
MKLVAKRLLFWVFMMAVFPAVAQTIDETLATEDILTADDIQTIDERVRVVTELDQQNECLAPLIINRIDGLKRTMPAAGFLIETGLHTLNGQAILDTTKCRPLDDIQHIARADDLEVDFEAGKTYYVAYDRSHQSVDEWKLIVWKVELVPVDPAENEIQP